MSQVKKGTVIFFDPKRGYGFVDQEDDDKDIFVHYSNIQVEGFRTLKPGQIVNYEVGENHAGPQATNVVVVGEASE